jgi:hypothetical protein
VAVKLWQLLVLAALPALAAGLVLGRSSVAHNAPETAAPTPRDAVLDRSPTDDPAADASRAQAYVRAAVPALEAFYADTGAYTGVTVARLRSTYDESVGHITIVRADANAYCLESTVGTATFHRNGPTRSITGGHCR